MTGQPAPATGGVTVGLALLLPPASRPTAWRDMSTLDILLVLVASVLLVALELLFVMAIFAPQAVVRAVRRLAGG